MGRFNNYLAAKLLVYLKRDALSDPNHWIANLTHAQSAAGVNVTATNALQTSTVFACVRVLSETIASLPLKIYRKREDGTKKEAVGHPLSILLNRIGPNPWQTAPEFWEMQCGHNALRGNAYSYKVKNGNGVYIGFVPLNPANMQIDVKLDDFAKPVILYKYTVEGRGQPVDIPAADIWHLKGISTDGFTGLSPLSLAREAIGLSIAAESHGSVYFKNGARPSGVVSYPGKLKEPAYARFKDSIQDAISGGNKFKALLLEEGATWAQVGMTNNDSQFLETRQFQVEDIARIFRVPNILIGHPDKTSTYASAEQFMISFVTHTIRPWLVRLEKSISKHLLADERQSYFAEFKVDGLLRGDIKSRYDAYAVSIQNTWMCPNEVRALENMDPREGGDVYENPNINVKAQQDKKEGNQNNGKTNLPK